MSKKLNFLTLAVVFFALPLMATGPRVSSNVLSDDKNEIYALDMPPFISTEVPNGGVLSEIVTAAFSDQNIEISITIVPLQSMMKYYLLEEKSLAVMGRHLGISENEMKTLVSIPLYSSVENYIYYKPINEKFKFDGKMSSLKGLIYGASRGEKVTEYNKESIKVKKSRALSIFKKLKSGSVDFTSLPKESLQWFLENKFTNDKNNFLSVSGGAKMVPIDINFNLNHENGKDLSIVFKKGLRSIIKNGLYDSILRKYIKENSSVESQLKRINEFLR